jgi:hypothetical protein
MSVRNPESAFLLPIAILLKELLTLPRVLYHSILICETD